MTILARVETFIGMSPDLSLFSGLSVQFIMVCGVCLRHQIQIDKLKLSLFVVVLIIQKLDMHENVLGISTTLHRYCRYSPTYTHTRRNHG